MPSNAVLIASHIDKSLSKEAKRSHSDYYREYSLTVRLSTDGFSFSILDLERNKYIALESYILQEITSFGDLAHEAGAIIDQNDLLKRYFPKVLILFESNKTTIIPSALYDPSELNSYLKFNHKLTRDEEIIADRLVNLEAYNIHAVPDCIKEKLRDKFANFRLVNYSSALIESILISNKNQPIENTLFINARSSAFDVVYIEGRQLGLFNSFRYRTKEDFAYFLLFAIEQLKLNPESVKIVLMGEIDKNSNNYEIVYKYIRNIEFAERNDFFKYSYVFDDIPSWYYYNLINANLCEL